MIHLGRRPRAVILGVLALLSALLATGCLEQLETARLPGGAAQNFLYFLTHNEQADAMAYWAPDHVPADAATQVARAAARLQAYNVALGKTSAVPQKDGVMEVTVSGQVARRPEAPGRPDMPLLRGRLIMIGPGWRFLDFTLLCCASP